MNIRRLYYKIFLLFLFITFIASYVYRGYIYKNNINDCGLADMFPNIGAVIIASFLFLSKGKYKEGKEEVIIILSAILGFITYEFIQIIIPISTFDWKDILGTIIGGIITYVIYKRLTIMVNKKNIKNEVDYDV